MDPAIRSFPRGARVSQSVIALEFVVGDGPLLVRFLLVRAIPIIVARAASTEDLGGSNRPRR
jgi:hypothetical protein